MPIRVRRNTAPTKPAKSDTPTPKAIELSDKDANAKVEGAGGLTLREVLATPWLRLTHLYHIKDKHGEMVKFTPWPEQEEFYWGMHYLNILLKARQRGMTTIIQLFMLDMCLFNDNVNAGVIAHNREDAQKFFDDKIKYAYDKLPEALKLAIPSRSDNTNELKFANDSSIRVGTSMRSGTLQYLHVSEYGKICAKYPEKAQEIRAGSLNTVAAKNFVFIESTAEGAHGDFHDKCVFAEKAQQAGDELTDLDYKFFFFPWWRAKEYRLVGSIAMDKDDDKYFQDLADEHDVHLDQEQKNWYIKKRQEQGEVMMTQEYPSTSVEAFQGITDGAIFRKQILLARKEDRIRDLPYIPTIPVNTFWDVGRDMTTIWFHQRVGPDNRFIDYLEEPNETLGHFANLLLQSPEYGRYTYGHHYFPHDMGVTEYAQVESEQLTRQEVARKLGLKPSTVVPRIPSIAEGIELSRQAFASSYFDRKKCEKGIKCLENYRYEKEEKLETYKAKPLHNWASHGADSYRQFAQGYRFRPYSHHSDADNPLSRAYRRQTKDDKSEWRV